MHKWVRTLRLEVSRRHEQNTMNDGNKKENEHNYMVHSFGMRLGRHNAPLHIRREFEHLYLGDHSGQVLDIVIRYHVLP